MGIVEQANHYRRAKRYLARAIECDERNDYNTAIEYYRECCENFLAGLSHDPIPASRRRVIEAVKGYLSRAEYLVEATTVKVKKKSKKLQAIGTTTTTATLASEEFNKEAVKVAKDKGFDGVAGMSDVKIALKEAVILPMLHPKAFEGGRKPWKGVLLYGPPGTGKSHVAMALSKEAKCEFISLSSSDIMSKHQGESERAVKLLFEEARKKRPCVIFLDEIDSIGGTRDDSGSKNEASRRVLTELLKQMEGVGSDNRQITVVAATNHPFDIDPALRRRFEKRIYVPMPGPRARKKILQLNLGNNPDVTAVSKKEIMKLAEEASGYSGSDLANVANEALMIPVRKCMKATHFKYVPVHKAIGNEKQQQGGGVWNGFVGFINTHVFGDQKGSVLVPCSPWDVGAIRMSMMDEQFPCEKLRVPPITAADLKEALAKLKPSISAASLRDYSDFAQQFGAKNAIKDFEDREEDDESEDEEVRTVARAQVTSSSSSSSTNRVLVPG